MRCAVEEITAAGRIPLLWAGLCYILKALLEGLSPLPSANPEIRAEIEKSSRTRVEAIHQELASVDPVMAKRIHPNDPQRLSRALEVYLISGKSMTELTQISGEALPYDVYQFAIAPKDRNVLHQRIEARFKQMLTCGFEDEVKSAIPTGRSA